MSAFRTLSAADIDTLRRLAGADAVTGLQPVAAGIENSNWFLQLVRGDSHFPCVLTLVEAVPDDELPFFIALTDTLAEADLPVPMALRLAGGRRQFVLQDRPALLVPRLPGTHVDVPSPALCTAAGELLARLHAAARHCPLTRDRPDHRWWPGAFAWLSPLLDAGTRAELGAGLTAASLAFARAHALPHGVIHGDLFRDNVLVENDSISGVLDFFHATHDLLAWDIAIALNDWTTPDGTPDAVRADAFLAGYARVRRLSAAEIALLPALRRAAAARFWLSRLEADVRRREYGQEPVLITQKDPARMRELLAALPAG